MKRILAILITFTVIMSAIPAGAKGLELYYDGEYHTYTGSLFSLFINGERINTPLEPIIFNNRALVPLREVFEKLGAKVDYEDGTKKITVTKTDLKVQVQIGNNDAYINGKKTSIPDGVVPKLIKKVGGESKTMVPVRFISESIGLLVDFDDDAGAIMIRTPEVKKIMIKKPVVKKASDTKTVVTVNLSEEYTENIKASVTSSGVLYFDLKNAEYEGASQTQVNHGALAKIRLGLHEDYTRVAFDMVNYSKYDVAVGSDKKSITVTITSKAPFGSEEDKKDEEEKPAIPSENPSEKPEEKPGEDNTTEIPPEEEKVVVTTDVKALKNYTPSKGVKYVVIDAGHGGSDPGAIGNIDEEKYHEKTIALEVAKLVEEGLKAEGIEVVMTRSGDTYPTLNERAELANKKDAAIFVSIHVNAASNAPKANGIEVYYAGKNNHSYYGTTSKALATAILKDMISETQATNRGVKSENHLVTRKSVMPAVLVELGFISNEDELKKITDKEYQKKLSAGIISGVMSQLGKIKVPERRDLAEKLVADEIGEEKAEEYMNEMWK